MIPAYIERMLEELKELDTKLQKLNKYMDNYFTDLDDTERYLMKVQADVMYKYVDILKARIEHAILKGEYEEVFSVKNKKEDEK